MLTRDKNLWNTVAYNGADNNERDNVGDLSSLFTNREAIGLKLTSSDHTRIGYGNLLRN